MIVKADSKKTYVAPFGEGVDDLCCISSERLAWFDEWMTEHPISLVRSPPFSGKTTLANILGDYLRGKQHNVISISMLDMETYHADRDIQSFDNFWMTSVGISWTQCANSNEPIDIMLDEVQMIYGLAGFFWAKIKLLMQTGTRNKNVRILLLGMYGDTDSIGTTATPVQLKYTVGLNTLRLRSDEYEKLVDRLIKVSATNGLTMRIPDIVRNAIFNITLGHPGITREALDFLRDRYRRGVRDAPGMLRLLVSPAFRNSMQETRALRWLTQDFTQEQEQFLRKALYQMGSESSFPIDTWTNSTVTKIIKDFKHCGILTDTITADNNPEGSTLLQFAVPLVRVILGQRLFTSSQALRTAENFEEFLTLSISRMQPSKLRISLSKTSNESRIYERAWQMEWFRAASTAVPPQSSLSPDVGPIFGATGFLDFYVNNNLEWGVELLREGDRMKEHAGRFADGGQYENIPLKRWVIIDFRHESKGLLKAKPNYWHVIYDNDYRKLTIKREGHDDQQLFLAEGGDAVEVEY